MGLWLRVVCSNSTAAFISVAAITEWCWLYCGHRWCSLSPCCAALQICCMLLSRSLSLHAAWPLISPSSCLPAAPGRGPGSSAHTVLEDGKGPMPTLLLMPKSVAVPEPAASPMAVLVPLPGPAPGPVAAPRPPACIPFCPLERSRAKSSRVTGCLLHVSTPCPECSPILLCWTLSACACARRERKAGESSACAMSDIIVCCLSSMTTTFFSISLRREATTVCSCLSRMSSLISRPRSRFSWLT